MLNDALASSHFAISGKLTGYDAIVVRGALRPRRRSCWWTAPAPGSSRRQTCRGLPAAEAERGSRRPAGPGLAGRRDRPGGRTRRPLRHDLPRRAARRPRRPRRGAGGQEPQGRRRPRRAPRSPRPTRQACSPPRGTCAPARSGRPPPSTASWARWPTCSPSTRSARCPPATSPAATFDGAPRLAAEELAGAAQRRAQQLRVLHDRLRAHLPRRAAAAAAGGVRERVRPRPDVRGLRPRRRARRQRPLRRARARHDLGRRHDRLGDGVRRAGPDRRAVAAVRRRRRAAAGAGRDRRTRGRLGELLAEGSRRAAERVGGGSDDFAPQVKGLELPGYEPRTLQAMALGLAVNARGADHNRSGAYEADLSGDLDRLDGGEAHVARGGRDRGPGRGDGLDDPVQVPARGLRRPVHRSGRPCCRRSPAGTSTATSCAPRRGGSCWPSGCSTCARAGSAGRRLAAGPAAARAAGARARAGWPR